MEYFTPSAMRDNCFPFLGSIGMECCKLIGNDFQISDDILYNINGIKKHSKKEFFIGIPENLLLFIKEKICILNKNKTYSAFYDVPNFSLYYLFLSLLYCRIMIEDLGNVFSNAYGLKFELKSTTSSDKIKNIMQWCRKIIIETFHGIQGIDYKKPVGDFKNDFLWKDAVITKGIMDLTVFMGSYACFQHDNIKCSELIKKIGYNAFPTMALDWTFDKRVASTQFGDIVVSIDYDKWQSFILNGYNKKIAEIEIGDDRGYTVLSTDLYKPNSYNNENMHNQAGVSLLWLWKYTIDELCNKDNVVGKELGFSLESN
jgi:hypothetical protein